MITDFKYNEIIFVEIQRVFHTFLAQNGYYLDFYHYWDQNTDRDYDTIHFTNSSLRQQMSFSLAPFSIVLIKKYYSFCNLKTKSDGFYIVTIDIKDYLSMHSQIEKINYGIFNDFEGYKNLSNKLPIENSYNILKSYRDFIERELMPVLKGEIWIDELLKRKGIKNDNYK
jgi:hypothetical protein